MPAPSTISAAETDVTKVAKCLRELVEYVTGNTALATDATNGFRYMPTCAGTPTGVPETFPGRVAYVYDTSNEKLYVYNGGWVSVTLS